MAMQRIPTSREITKPDQPGPVDPMVLQTILQDEIAGRLADLTELLSALGALTQKMEKEMLKVAQGRMIPFKISLPTPDRSIGLMNLGPHFLWRFQDFTGMPAVSANLFSDGPNSVYVCLNDLSDGFSEVKSGENLVFEFNGNSKIRQFFFKVNPGEIANLRIPMEF